MEWFIDNAVLRVMMPIINISVWVLSIIFLSFSPSAVNSFHISGSGDQQRFLLSHSVPYLYRYTTRHRYCTTLKRCSLS